VAHPASREFTLALKSDPKQVIKVERFLEKLKDNIRLNDVLFNRLLVATTEAVNNGIIHGNKRDPGKTVIITCSLNGQSLVVRVQDEGPGVDPSKLPDPLSEENLLRENGRGVFLMRSLMDEVVFEKVPGGSIVVMKINLN
jgi:serine/threonine-protein kinase RsbW